MVYNKAISLHEAMFIIVLSNPETGRVLIKCAEDAKHLRDAALKG